jgi:hypothetical protein
MQHFLLSSTVVLSSSSSSIADADFLRSGEKERPRFREAGEGADTFLVPLSAEAFALMDLVTLPLCAEGAGTGADDVAPVDGDVGTAPVAVASADGFKSPPSML